MSLSWAVVGGEWAPGPQRRLALQRGPHPGKTEKRLTDSEHRGLSVWPRFQQGVHASHTNTQAETQKATLEAPGALQAVPGEQGSCSWQWAPAVPDLAANRKTGFTPHNCVKAV